MQQRVNFITLVVAELERARRFYLRGLGWTAALDVPGEADAVGTGLAGTVGKAPSGCACACACTSTNFC